MASGRRLAFGTLRSPLLADPETASTLGSTWYRTGNFGHVGAVAYKDW